MHYHLLLTEECNKDCIYCGGFTHSEVQSDISYDLEVLKAFMARDPEASISFYGGEPTLNIPLLEKVMDTVPARRFQIQSNGTHIDGIGPDYIARLHTILLSIDGGRERTDHNRGEGTYDTVLGAARFARANGFTGDMIARMAVTDGADIHEDVSHLAGLGVFDNVHWQLDVLWCRREWRDLAGWIEDSYDPGISRLVAEWVGGMETGKVGGLVPFKALTGLMLRRGRTDGVWCGAGRDCFAITPRGEIMVCPIDPSHTSFLVGNIVDSTPDGIRGSLLVGEPCPSCDILDICGGRCLYANRTGIGGPVERAMVCGTVRHLIEELRAVVPRIRELIDEETVPREAFDYPDGNNSCEVIP